MLFITDYQFSEIPRAPSPGCCPDAYLHLCCLGIPPCNASKVVIPPAPATGSFSKESQITFQGHNIKRYPCSSPWRTTACAEGFYSMNGSVESCPPGMYIEL